MMSSTLTTLRRRVTSVPTSPGVYRWLDKAGSVLYVGKAKDLRKRMQQYVRAGAKLSPWTTMMVRQVADFTVTVTNSELEALMLETNLIKELRPKYNILMKDDKNYVYVRVTVQDQFPRVEIVRRLEEDGSLYFGPKTSAFEVQSTLSFLRTLFPFRNCKMGIEVVESETLKVESEGKIIPLDVICKDRDRPTPCVDYHIKQCCAPCIGTVTPDEYRTRAIDGVVAFLRGKYQDVEQILIARMKEAAATKKFERAAKLRDQLAHLRSMQEKQIVSDTSGANTDTVGVALLSGHAFVSLLREREGKLVGEESFALQGTAETLADVLEQFLPQYYLSASDLPDTIVVGVEPAGRETIDAWLRNLRGKRINLHIPERGKKSKILSLAEKNAEEKARLSEATWEAEMRKVEDAQKELATLLGLPSVPRRIEGYDISHLGGTATVGSMVVFVNGKPKREHYRSFNIRSVTHGEVDDYKALAETLRRRLKYLTQDLRKEESQWKAQGITFGKSRKGEHARILEIHREQYRHINDKDIDFARYLIARRKRTEIVGFCRVVEHAGGYLELKSLWVQDAERGAKLGQMLVRKMLSLEQKRKAKKIYITAKSDLVEYYGELGFRHSQHPPAIILEKHREAAKEKGVPPGEVMVYLFSEHKPDDSFQSMPDLILVDGGKGQLTVCVKVLEEFGLTIPIAGLAKREEEIFVPGSPVSLAVTKDSQARFLLQRLRDEAHRFANAKREKRLESALLSSALDEVSGVGPKTKVKRLKGTVRNDQ